MRCLVIFEDPAWRQLRPLTDVLPVPALAFGASTLAERWLSFTGLPLAAIVARREPMAAWSSAPAPAALPDSADEVMAVNAAALPGPWLEAALAKDVPARFEAGGRVVAVRASFTTLERALRAGEEIETALRALAIPVHPVEARVLAWPWKIIEWNAEAIADDLARITGRIEGNVDERAALLEPARIAIGPEARIDPFAVLDARSGPIAIGRGVHVLAHTVVTGPCSVGAGTQLLGGFVGRSTFGPQCRVAGEVEDCVWQGYGNKRHHGFVGHSVIGEWVNLGALTTTSDLKNNYGPVRVWIDGREVDSGSPKVGALIGAHVKTGIGTLLPTGASVGVGSNLFGGGRFAPKHVAAFSWWDGDRIVEHRLDQFLATARIAMSRRGRALDEATEHLIRSLHGAADTQTSGLAAAPVGRGS
jgi:UDP-N-acetylglucosamine diphosphorylase/glucosamine-1-phosphate N-acetyltransferase